jgi:glucose/arabinose dehydrogenase
MRTAATILVIGLSLGIAGAAEPKPRLIVSGMQNPTAVTIGSDGRTYVAVMGQVGTAGDGGVVVLDGTKAVPFARGLDDPSGMVAWNGALFVVDQTRIWRIDKSGTPTVFVAATDFPAPPQFLNEIAVDERGFLYVADSGEPPSSGGIYRITGKGKVDRVATNGLKGPHGIVMDGMSHLLVTDDAGVLHRLQLADGEFKRIADGAFIAAAWDWRGRLYLASSRGQVFVRPRPGTEANLLAGGFGEIGGMCAKADGSEVLVVDQKNGSLSAITAQVPGQPCDETPLALTTELAFPNLNWAGWEPVDPAGRPVPFRPLVLTHAGDGSHRIFVATQHGVIYSFANDQGATQTKVFLDLQSKVRYDDRTNEEGFLGLAFHPRFKTNGEFFVFYTDKKAKLTNVVSRFRVARDDPDRADPASEEELLRIEHRYWNHDGGTVVFGPDGFLYIALGDGGSANDPEKNGQNLGTILGKVLRIDVDRKADGKPYAVPPDNPFASRMGARPEIFAYGLRNVWRMAFDRPTGRFWAADVGQNLYEEIVLLESGKNYGWNIREGLHPFGPRGVGHRADLVDPIWEYHHDIGKSITGGAVYRGPRLPELTGAYLYGDYVSMKLWALWYDEKLGRVTANRPIADPQVPILSFGEDERGELYFMTYTTTAKGIYRFARVANQNKSP